MSPSALSTVNRSSFLYPFVKSTLLNSSTKSWNMLTRVSKCWLLMSFLSLSVFSLIMETVNFSSSFKPASFVASFRLICLSFANISIHYEVLRLTIHLTQSKKMTFFSPKSFFSLHVMASYLNLSRMSFWFLISVDSSLVLPSSSMSRLMACPSVFFGFTGVGDFLGDLTTGLRSIASSFLFILSSAFFGDLDLCDVVAILLSFIPDSIRTD